MAPRDGMELKSLFSELVALGPAARAERLAAIGHSEPALRDALAALLAADENADARLARLDGLNAGARQPADPPSLSPADAAEHANPIAESAGAAEPSDGPRASGSEERAASSDPFGLAGETVGHFRVAEVLGAGGMGVVYRAQDLRLGREVALKLLPPHLGLDPDARRRFLREARAAATLDHPNIATVFEVGEAEGGRLFHATALYRGETLRQRLARGPVPTTEAADIATQVLRGLAHAHAAGVVHRDLKPENLILTPEGLVKIVDFGLATLPGTATSATLHAGTAAYMAPEQVRGEPVDARADLWALGVILYEMLAGQRPFQGDSELGLAHRILNETPRPVTALRPDVPGQLTRLVERLLQRDVAGRPPSAQAALDELTADRPAELRSGVHADGPGARARLGLRLHRRAWIAAGGIAVGLVGIVAVFHFWPASSRTGPGGVHSIAVLPFENLSPESASPYVGDGIAEQVLDQLGRIEGVRTVARTSSFQFRGKNLDARRIGRELGVTALLEGSVVVTADSIRVRVELVGTADGYRIWGEHYDRPRMDILALEDDIAGAIAIALAARVRQPVPGGLQPARVKPRAYDLYVAGRHLWYQRSPDALVRAAAIFDSAVAVDSMYALAYVGVADVQAMLGSFEYGVSPPGPAFERARAAALRALRLNPGLGPAHAALANVAMNYDRDWAGAEREFRRALQLSPDYAPAHQWYAFLLMSQRRNDEAFQQLEQAAAADPLSSLTATVRAQYFYFVRQYGEAGRALDVALRLDPGYSRAHLLQALLDMQTGQMAVAVDHLSRLRASAPNDPVVAAVLAYALGRSGRVAEARALGAWLTARAHHQYVPPELNALVYIGLGQHGPALDRIEDAFRQRSGGVLYLPVDPLLDPLRGEPRFQQLLRRLPR